MVHFIDTNAIAIILASFVLPIWIILHYATKWKAARGLGAQDEKLLADLWESARRMEERLDNLERAIGAEPERKP